MLRVRFRAHQRFVTRCSSRAVWQDGRNGTCGDDGNGWDIWMHDFSTGEDRAVTTAFKKQQYPRVDDQRIVYQSDEDCDGSPNDSNIYLYDLYTRESSVIAMREADQEVPDVSGGVVDWAEYYQYGKADWDIYAYDLSTDTETQLCDDSSDQYWPKISGDTVVWEDGRNWDQDIYGYDLAEDEEIEICTSSGSQWSPVVEDGVVAWLVDRDGYDALYVYDLATEVESEVASSTGSMSDLEIGGGVLVWSDSVTGDGDVYSYDLATESLTQHTDAEGCDGMPAVSDGILLYNHYIEEDGYPDMFAILSEDITTSFSSASGVSPETDAAMQDIGVSSLLLLGGTGVVPDSVATLADSDRLGGINRYGTAVAIATYGEDTLGMSWNRFGLATGEDFPDAMTAGVGLGKSGSPMLLTPPTYLDSTTAAAIAAHKLAAMDVWFIGGMKAISADVRAEVESLIPQVGNRGDRAPRKRQRSGPRRSAPGPLRVRRPVTGPSPVHGVRLVYCA